MNANELLDAITRHPTGAHQPELNEQARAQLATMTPEDRFRATVLGLSVWSGIVVSFVGTSPTPLAAQGRDVLRLYCEAYLAALKELQA